MAGKRFGSAKADCQLCDFQRIEETEALGLTAFDEYREGRACAGAMAVVDILLPRIGNIAQLTETLDLRMCFQKGADLCGILARTRHAKFERFEAS